jgi:hypothetical protein
MPLESGFGIFMLFFNICFFGWQDVKAATKNK